MLSILADVLTADMGLVPGLAFAGPGMGLPLSVLAAYVERPFYTLAGIEQKTIWYSLQANLVSLFIGFVIFMILFMTSPLWALTPLGMLLEPPSIGWVFFAIAASTYIEGRFLSRRHQSGKGFWRWTAIGNMASAGACIALLVMILGLRKRIPDWGEAVKPFELILNLIALAGSVALFFVAFRRTRGDTSDAPAPIPTTSISEI
jgi:hypothetical protein